MTFYDIIFSHIGMPAILMVIMIVGIITFSFYLGMLYNERKALHKKIEAMRYIKRSDTGETIYLENIHSFDKVQDLPNKYMGILHFQGNRTAEVVMDKDMTFFKFNQGNNDKNRRYYFTEKRNSEI